MAPESFRTMFHRLLSADGQSYLCKTVEVFGWVIFIEGVLILVVPKFVAAVLALPELSAQAANYFRLAGLLVSGLGTLYVICGRLNAVGFAFASLLDRPLVPPVMAVLWYLGLIPGNLALAFAIQDSAGVLWTLSAWRKRSRSR